MPNTPKETSNSTSPKQDGTTASRGHRKRRLVSAWITLVPSKAVTFIFQAVAIPTVYHAIGQEQFATYTAVTAALAILGFLNLGMGGALVTPLAQAAARGDHQQEAQIVGATFFPLCALSFIAFCAFLPVNYLFPKDMLFGVAATTIPAAALRNACLLACIGVVGSVPLSIMDNARQAYQETHISILFGSISNLVVCAGLLLSAWLHPTLVTVVAVTSLLPLAVKLINVIALLVRRSYLLQASPQKGWLSLAKQLFGDGISYTSAAALSNILAYQWPIYYMARTKPTTESSAFAIMIQFILLVLSFGVSLAQPLWPAIADAAARLDRHWIAKTIRQAKSAALLYGLLAFLLLGNFMNTLLTLWIHKPIKMAAIDCWLCGLYILLATWEYVHWPLTLGLGGMRPASHLVFLRSVVSAILVPFMIHYGQKGLLLLLCSSAILVTAWSYPLLLDKTLAKFTSKENRAAIVPVHA